MSTLLKHDFVRIGLLRHVLVTLVSARTTAESHEILNSDDLHFALMYDKQQHTLSQVVSIGLNCAPMSFLNGSLAGSVVSLSWVACRVFSPGAPDDREVYPGPLMGLPNVPCWPLDL